MATPLIFTFDAYKPYVHARIKALPQNGRGEMAKLARALRMHPTRLSHIFNGAMNLTAEQACETCNYFGLSELEAEYFMALVQLERAGSHELEKMVRRQLGKIKARSKEMVNRVPSEKVLTDEEKAVFYSSWAYTTVRLMTSIEEFKDVTTIARELRMPTDKVRGIVDFLLATGLCVEGPKGLAMGPKTTHLESTSELVLRHHTNWRLKALSRHETLGEGELAYTCPVSISLADLPEIREMLADTVSRFLKKVVASEPCETVACLNIDWFKVKN